MPLPISVETAPAEEPVTLAQAIDHLREDIDNAQTDLIRNLISAARVHAEQFTRRAFVTQTLQYRINDFRDTILVPRPPLQSIGSITYIDLEGNTQTLSSDIYDVDTDSEPGIITRAYQQVWPSVRSVHLPVTITYDAGYGDADSVPQAIKQAMLMLISHWYEHRDSVHIGAIPSDVPMAFESLMWPYRMLDF